MEYNNFIPKSRAELKSLAKEKLKGNWVNAIIVCIVISLLSNGLNFTYTFHEAAEGVRTGVNFGQLLNLIIGGPLALGSASFFLKLLRNEDPRIEEAFSGFKNFASAFLVQLLTGIFTTLWMLLLIVPGIIAALSYSMAFYILRDNPEISAMEAIKESKKLMDGEKGRLFVLGLSFIGWILVGVITIGIGLIWIIPYISATTAAFYEDLRERKLVSHKNYQTENEIYTENP